MNKEIVERWMTFSPKNEKDAFSRIVHFFPEMENGLIDIRGFPFGRDEIRNDLRDYTFKNVDFSYSYFRNCNLFKMKYTRCTFIDCDFSELRLWDTVFTYCVFIRSNFQNATMGKDCLYENCRFESCKLKGKYFSFGCNTKFESCDFIKCNIQSAQILSVEFKKCVFESSLISIRFTGKYFSDIENIDIKRKSYPTMIIDCDFRKSTFDKVEIFDDIESKNTGYPDQTFKKLEKSKYYERNPTTAST